MRDDVHDNTVPRAVDLFSGCGGMSLGFINAGFEVVEAYDNWSPAVDVYRRNFNHPILELDLSNVEKTSAIVLERSPDIIIGGPPCQDFSTAGLQDETRGRAALSLAFAKIVEKVRPKWFVMENVPTMRRSPSFPTIQSIFKKAGYGLTCTVLDAAYCGVPQKRKRLFIIGGIDQQDGFLTDCLLSGQSDSPLSVREYLGDSLGIDNYFRVPTNYQRRGVFSIDEPSMTIRGVDRPIPKGYKGHPKDSAPIDEVRPLTPKERSLIQTFPEEFVFVGSKSNINQMIGNAVPVKLAEYVAQNLIRFIIKDGKCSNACS